MKYLDVPNINTKEYWDDHQTAMDFGLRQQKYSTLAGSGFNIVELGCGLSPFLHHAKFQSKYGIDFSPKTVFEAGKLFPDVEYIISDCTRTPFPNKEFDVSVAGEVIEHMENPESLISEMVRITKNKIIISTPILEFKDPEHLWQFSEKDFEKMLAPFGTVTCETIKSERFPGRSYIFATCLLTK